MVNYYNIGNFNNIHMLLYVCRFVKLGDDAVKMSVEQPTMKSTCLYVEFSIWFVEICIFSADTTSTANNETHVLWILSTTVHLSW